MPNRPPSAPQSRTVVVNGRAYAWDAERGLAPAAAEGLLHFARKKAWGYASWAARTGLEVEDLVQEGLTGALRAAAKYDPDAGASYLTYAAWYIDSAMRQALARPIVRTPEGAAPALVGSLDAPLANDQEEREPARQEWQRDDQPGPHDLFAAAEDRARLRRALPRLDPRDRAVLTRHLGLDGRAPQSLQAVARDLGVTRQRAAQLFDRARTGLRQELGSHSA